MIGKRVDYHKDKTPALRAERKNALIERENHYTFYLNFKAETVASRLMLLIAILDL